MSKNLEKIGSRFLHSYEGAFHQPDWQERAGTKLNLARLAFGKTLTYRPEANSIETKVSAVAVRIFAGIATIIFFKITLLSLIFLASSKTHKNAHQKILELVKEGSFILKKELNSPSDRNRIQDNVNPPPLGITADVLAKVQLRKVGQKEGSMTQSIKEENEIGLEFRNQDKFVKAPLEITTEILANVHLRKVIQKDEDFNQSVREEVFSKENCSSSREEETQNTLALEGSHEDVSLLEEKQSPPEEKPCEGTSSEQSQVVPIPEWSDLMNGSFQNSLNLISSRNDLPFNDNPEETANWDDVPPEKNAQETETEKKSSCMRVLPAESLEPAKPIVVDFIDNDLLDFQKRRIQIEGEFSEEEEW